MIRISIASVILLAACTPPPPPPIEPTHYSNAEARTLPFREVLSGGHTGIDEAASAKQPTASDIAKLPLHEATLAPFEAE